MILPTAPIQDEILQKPEAELIRDHGGTTELWRLAKRAIELEESRRAVRTRAKGEKGDGMVLPRRSGDC